MRQEAAEQPNSNPAAGGSTEHDRVGADGFGGGVLGDVPRCKWQYSQPKSSSDSFPIAIRIAIRFLAACFGHGILQLDAKPDNKENACQDG